VPASPSSPVALQRRPGATPRRGRPGVALTIVLGAQLMVILDATVVNIALPSIQGGLHFSATSLSWVMNAYALTFGGLLLLGGRAGDILGRRRVFLAGIALFTIASLTGGLATSAGWLIAARAAQGTGAAIASPAALSLVVAAFPEGHERNRAVGRYSAVSMGGASLGLVLGGLITEWASWRWVLFINVPVGILILAAAPAFIGETTRAPGHFDVAGALASTTGMASLVYAFIRAVSAGWSDSLTLGALATAAVALALFVLTETRARQPITPLRLFADRGRSGAYLARLFLVAGMFGMFFFLTQFLQDVLGLRPLQAGVAFLPMTLVVFAVSRLSARLLSRYAPGPLTAAGTLPVIAGMAWLSRITPGTAYLPGVLGPMLLFGFGMGIAFVPLTTAALAGVRREDSGAASGMVNATQQVGGALGLAILVSVSGAALRAAGQHPAASVTGLARAHDAFVSGMAHAFTMSTVFDVCALLVVLLAGLSAQRPAGRRQEAAVTMRSDRP
jgi:EmrB/QacA subfamily drug resistance transporter